MKELPRSAARELKKLNDLFVRETRGSELIDDFPKHVHNSHVATVTRGPEIRLLLRLRAIRPERIIPAAWPLTPGDREVQVRDIPHIGRPIPRRRVWVIRRPGLVRPVFTVPSPTVYINVREDIVVPASRDQRTSKED
jgi:hypothetical protein